MTIETNTRPFIEKYTKTAVRRLRDTFGAEGWPHKKALSFSLGTFISLLPTPGLNILLASGLATGIKTLHRGALFAAIGVWNTLVVTPLYGLAYKLGIWWFGEMTAAEPTFMAQFINFSKSFLLGNLAIAAGVTFCSYLIVRSLLSTRGSSSTASR